MATKTPVRPSLTAEQLPELMGLPRTPAAAFWSLTAYDSATRSMVQNPTNDAAHASYDELETNADGSSTSS
jgi:hypothetical protein